MTKKLTRKLSIKRKKNASKLKPIDEAAAGPSVLNKTLGANESMGAKVENMTLSDGGITQILRERDQIHDNLDNRSEGRKES